MVRNALGIVKGYPSRQAFLRCCGGDIADKLKVNDTQ